MWQEFSLFLLFTWICLLHLSKLKLIAGGCDGCHALGRRCLLNLEHLVVLLAGPIFTLALNTLILSIFYISLDLSTIYFAHFSEYWASFVCSCHSILKCCVIFSGVKLSNKIVCFISCFISDPFLFFESVNRHCCFSKLH